ncbi:MAG: UPF0280 family protein [Deltaproteobacteria bacterium]|nr:UPF0280 family protein [Deltaproteobacteria bacterium]
MSGDARHTPGLPGALGYTERTYRRFEATGGRRVPFRACVETTDLYLLADRDLSAEALTAALAARGLLDAHIERHPAFATALRPLPLPAEPLPALLERMYRAARTAEVGPMAAVAGAIAQTVGEELRRHAAEVLVENGGDLYLDLEEEAVAGVFAGASPFSGRLGLRVTAERTPLGLCTSSGTVGPSLSFGCADAAIVLAADAALADAMATALGNRIQGPGDLEAAVDWALAVPGVRGAVAILGDRMAARGDVEFVEIGHPQSALGDPS